MKIYNLTKIILLILFFKSSLVSAQMSVVWVKEFNGSYHLGGDLARAITLDDSGNVYITGTSQISSSFNENVTIKYNKFGDSVWVRHYPFAAGNDIVVDDSGNVYVAGRGIIKYDKNGNFKWGNPDYDSLNYPTGYYKIMLDSSGNIYGGGIHLEKLTAGKFDRNGNRMWRKSYSFPGSAGTDRFGDVVMDRFGNIIITGRSKSITSDNDYATIKYSNNGDLTWSRRYNGPSTYSSDNAFGISADLEGNIYVTGASMDSIDNFNCLTIKYDSSGNIIWLNRIPTSTHIAATGYKIETDSSQNVFIAGRLGGSTSTIKLDRNGSMIWYRIYPEGGAFDDNFPVIVLDSAYNIYVTATSTASGAADYAAIKYDSSGNQIYVVKYNSSNIRFDYAYDIAIDKKGSVYLTGEFSAYYGAYGTVKFSPIMTGISGNSTLPLGYNLHQNYPNPFNPSTKIEYELPVEGNVSILVYDITGKLIRTLVNENKTAGRYEVTFDGQNFASGIYYYRIESGNFSQVRKMILIK